MKNQLDRCGCGFGRCSCFGSMGGRKKEGNIIHPNDIYTCKLNESIKDKRENNNKNYEKKEEELNKEYEHEKNMRKLYDSFINEMSIISNDIKKINKIEENNVIDNFLVKTQSKYIQINNDYFDKLTNYLIDNTKIKLNEKYNNQVDEIEYLNKKSKNKFHDNKISSGDHIIKKIRVMVLKAIFKFINAKIKTHFNDKIGKSICIKKFLPISRRDLSHSNVEFDKIFIYKKLKEILSMQISNKYTAYLDDHNNNLVQYLINEEKNGKYFQELFELSFLDCLEHICDKKNNELLNGLDKIDEIFANEGKLLNEDEKEIYKDCFQYYEKLVVSKKTRKTKTSKKSIFSFQ